MAAGKPASNCQEAGERGEKRITRRAKRRIMVRFGEGAPEKTAFTKNVSGTGLFLQTNSVFKPGTVLSVEMHFPDRTFALWARVIWAKKVPPQLAHVLECGMGVCFLEPTAEWLSFYESWARGTGAI